MTNATDALRALLQEVLGECAGMECFPCEGSMAPFEDLCGRIARALATPAGSASGEVQRYFRGEYGMVAAGPEYPRRDGDTYWVAEQDYAALQAEVARLREDATRYRWLRDLPACSFSLSFNDHRVMYESAKQTMENHAGDPKADYFGDVPADERARMIEADTIWTLHVYPHTPVGFNVYHGSTLDAAIDAAMGSANGQADAADTTAGDAEPEGRG